MRLIKRTQERKCAWTPWIYQIRQASLQTSQLQSSDPAKFKSLMSDISSSLTAAAKAAGTDTQEGKCLPTSRRSLKMPERPAIFRNFNRRRSPPPERRRIGRTRRSRCRRTGSAGGASKAGGGGGLVELQAPVLIWNHWSGTNHDLFQLRRNDPSSDTVCPKSALHKANPLVLKDGNENASKISPVPAEFTTSDSQSLLNLLNQLQEDSSNSNSATSSSSKDTLSSIRDMLTKAFDQMNQTQRWFNTIKTSWQSILKATRYTSCVNCDKEDSTSGWRLYWVDEKKHRFRLNKKGGLGGKTDLTQNYCRMRSEGSGPANG